MSGTSSFSDFGARLARFIELKKLDTDVTVGLHKADLEGGIEDSVSNVLLLEKLASALGLRVQDVFVLAGAAVPEGLIALDPAAGISAVNTAFAAVSLPTERIQELRRLVRALPQETRTKPVSPPPKKYGPGPGGFLLGLLDNRNLARYHTAKALYLGTLGKLYLSEVEVRHILVRDKPLAPDVFAGFASVIGIPAGELAVLTGFRPPPGVFPEHGVPTVVAELLWEVRRLSSEQARNIADVARSMLGDNHSAGSG